MTFSKLFPLTSSRKLGFFKMIHVVFCLVQIGSVDTFSPRVISGISKQSPFPKFPRQRNSKQASWQVSPVDLGASSAPGVLMLTCSTGSQLRTSENKRRKTLWNVISTWYMPDRKETSPLWGSRSRPESQCHSKECQEVVVVGVVQKEGKKYLKEMPDTRKAA